MEESVAMEGRELMDDLGFLSFNFPTFDFVHQTPVHSRVAGATDRGPCDAIANVHIAVGQDAVAVGQDVVTVG